MKIIITTLLSFIISFSLFSQEVDWVPVNYNLGDPKNFNVAGLFPFEEHGLVAAIEYESSEFGETGLYQLDENANTWTRIGGTGDPRYDFGSIKSNGETLFEHSGTYDGTKQFDFETGEWDSILDASGEVADIKANIIVGDMFYQLVGEESEGFWVESYNTATQTYEGLGRPADGEAPPLPPENRNKMRGVSAITNGKVYVGYRDLNLDDSGSTDNVRGKLFEWDGTRWTDISNTGLDYTTPTGGVGQLGIIYPSADFTQQYANTELNTYLKDNNSDGWFHVANFPYNESIRSAFGDYLFGVGSGVIYRYENNVKIRLGNNPIVEGCTTFSRTEDITSTDDGKTRFFAEFRVDSPDCGNNAENKGIYTYTLPSEDAPATVSNLHVDYATYLGNEVSEGNSNVGSEVAVGENHFYIAGNFGAGTSSGEVITYDEWNESRNNSPGSIIVTDATGSAIQKVLKMGDEIMDIALSPDGDRLTVVGSFGVVCLSSEGDYVWHSEEGVTEESVVSIAANYEVVALLETEQDPAGGGIVKHYASDGSLKATNKLRDQNGVKISDILIHSGANHNKIYLGGYVQADVNLQVAYLDAYSIEDINQLVFRTWGFSASAAFANDDIADTRVYHIAANDDYVYVAAESAGGGPGGATIFAYDGETLGDNYTALEGNDSYTDGTNSCGPCHITYISRINPSDGLVEKGKFIHARLTDGKTNTHRVRDGSLAVDAEGNVHIGAVSAAFIQNRATLNINGQLVGPYEGGDMVYLMLSPDMDTRYTWTAFSKSGGKGEPHGIDAAFGKTAILGTTNGGVMHTTDNALASTTSNQSPNSDQGIEEVTDVYFAAWASNIWETANEDERILPYVPADTCYTETCEKVALDDGSGGETTAFDLLAPSNVLTPNGDGRNDQWTIDGLTALDGDLKVVIISGAGQTVYQSNDYNNDWDGRRNNGDYLPAGIYYYVISQGSGKKTGYITIIR